MISRMNGNGSTVVIRRSEDKCHGLARQRSDDSVFFRRTCMEGQSELRSIARDLINESPKVELTESKRLIADDGLVMREDSLVDRVHQALLATGYGQLRKLQIYCVNGRIMLRGRLPTYYLKQIAQSVTRSVAGVREIENEVEVVSRR